MSTNYNSKYFKVLIKLVILEVFRSSRIATSSLRSKRVDTLNMKRCFENVNRMRRNAYFDVREYTHFAELTFRYLARVLPRRSLWFSDRCIEAQLPVKRACDMCGLVQASQAQRPNFRVWIEYECYFGETRNVFKRIFRCCNRTLHRMTSKPCI